MEIQFHRLSMLLLPLIGCGINANGADIVVTNPSGTDRTECVVEIPGEKIFARYGKDFSVCDADGNRVAHQISYDGKLLLQSDFKAGNSASFNIVSGESGDVPETVCIGQIRHDFQDDFTWENDRSGYRLYGPSYRRGGGNVAGYDIWTKSVAYPVLAQRYVDHCQHGISYHKDYGNGMDCYTVGKTLGAGMNALAPGGEIAYPCAYKECEILENGPLRTTARIVCYADTLADGDIVTEERIISLDRGSWLNKTTVKYHGLDKPQPLVTGIVVHKQNPRGVVEDPDKRFVAYADLTDNTEKGNGVIYIGIVNPTVPERISYQEFSPAAGDAIGQVMNHLEISPGEEYTYYWGSGWSKGGVRGVDHWTRILSDFHDGLAMPLEVRVNIK